MFEEVGGVGFGIIEVIIMMQVIVELGVGVSGVLVIYMNIFGLNLVVKYGIDEQCVWMLVFLIVGE